MLRTWISAISALVILLPSAGAFAQEKQEKPDLPTIVTRLSEAAVKVEYWLKDDNSESPPVPDDGIDDRRPFREPGWLVGDREVITEDKMIHPRFIERIVVTSDLTGETVDARPAAFGVDQDAMWLTLDKPFSRSKPVSFVPDAPGPYLVGMYKDTGAGWATYAAPMSEATAFHRARGMVMGVDDPALILSRDGRIVTATYTKELPVDGSWKRSPAQWARTSTQEEERVLARLAERCAQSIARAAITMRSPTSSGAMEEYYGGYQGGESRTLWDGPAIILPGNRVALLMDLTHSEVRRIESIEVALGDEQPVEAEFVGITWDWGVLIARLSTPLGEPISIAKGDAESIRKKQMFEAQVRVSGESQLRYFKRTWLSDLITAFRDITFAESAGGGYDYYYSSDQHFFFFDNALELASVRISRRTDADAYSTGEYDGPYGATQPLLRTLLGFDGDVDFDPSYVPVAEEDENRVVWLGVETQAMDEDLARFNNVIEETRDGALGAIVTFVYPGSPADRAGIRPEDVLLRVRTAARPRPIDIMMDSESAAMMEQFWQFIDRIPDMSVFDRLPTPWPSINNGFNKDLTLIGGGEGVMIEYMRGGRPASAELPLEWAPEHYETAKRYINQDLGMTVRDMTFEVHRYYQRANDSPGVIVSKVEQGGKTAVAGIRPFEIITHINDLPVSSAAEFERVLAEAEGELRMSVRRITEGRIVKVRR